MIIELLDGTRFDIADYNLKRLYHYVPSATIEHNSVAVDGRSDVILNSKINNRTISVDFVYISQDIFDFYALREEVNALFLRQEAYYIIFKNEPHKRWLVKVANQYNLQPNQKLESFTVEFLTMNTYAESVATTNTLKEWDVDSWSWNGAIDWETDLQYSFSGDRFTVRNLGNAIVDPRQSFLEITIFTNTNDFIQVINNTTGDIYRYDGVLTTANRLVISGINTLVDGISRFRNTNRQLISLAPGDNLITIGGARAESINFNFRFLYK